MQSTATIALYRYEKPACRLLKTSQESREWLIFSTQRHRVLISSPLSPSQKQCETNPSKEKECSRVCKQLTEEKSLHSQKLPQWAQQIYVGKEKSRYSQCYKKFLYAGPKYFDKLKPGQTYNSAPCQKFHSKISTCITTEKYIWD